MANDINYTSSHKSEAYSFGPAHSPASPSAYSPLQLSQSPFPDQNSIQTGPYGPAYSDRESKPPSLADRVFGRQLQQGSFELRLSTATASRRAEIHKAQMAEMDEWRNQVLNQLNFASRPYRLTTPQQIGQLQRLAQQLESDRRREELAYWKDMAEIRQQSLEQAFEYRAARDRYGLLGRSGANA